MRPSQTEIKNQVNQILESRDFQASSKLSGFLRFIVEETVNGNEDQLKGYTIATKVLGRGNDFDQSKDPIVRILAGRLRRALNYYYHTNGKADPVHINIPLGSYVPEFRLKKNGNSDPLQIENFGHNSEEQQKLRIAVFPFKDPAGNSDNELLLEDLRRDIIFKLSRLGILEISAVHNDSSDISEVYQKDRTRFILNGNFRKEKNTIKIYIELIDLKSNQVLRADKYDIDIKNNSSLNSLENIADNIVSISGSEYGVISGILENEAKSKDHTCNYEYEYLLKFYSLQHSLQKKTVKNFLQSIEKAIQTRSDNGMLHSFTAGLSLFSFMFNLNAVNDPMTYGGEQLLNASRMESDNQLIRALTVLYYFLQNEMKMFKDEIDRSLSLSPVSPYCQGLYGFLLIYSGDYQKGIKCLKSAIKRSYNYPSWWNIALAGYYFHKEEYENSYVESLKINLPDSFWSCIFTIASLRKLKRNDEVKKEIVKLKKLKPGSDKLTVEIIARAIKDKKLLDNLVDTLRKNGMGIKILTG